jgi:multidrug efflux pump subunit AcrA (membrane-fusion protein)
VVDLLKSVPDVAWAALVTGVFLTGQNWLNNRREDRRRQADAAERQADRELQLKQAEQARADARAETWRESRQEAHEALIAVLRKANKTVSSTLLYLRSDGTFWSTETGEAPEGDTDLLDEAEEEELNEALARVEIVGSEASRQAASAAVSQIMSMHERYWALTVLYSLEGYGEKRGDAAKRLKGKEESLKGNLDAYIDAVRRDLGTAD